MLCASSDPAHGMSEICDGEDLTVVEAGSKAKCLLSVNHTTKTNHHNHQLPFGHKSLLGFSPPSTSNTEQGFNFLSEKNRIFLRNDFDIIVCTRNGSPLTHKLMIPKWTKD